MLQCDTNWQCRAALFIKGDLVYVSTKNISLPKGLARKLAPKYIGPYRIVHNFGNSSFQLDLPVSLQHCGIHDVFFHASLLCVHEPNNDRLFLGHFDTQIFKLEDHKNKWAIEHFVAHRGAGTDAL